MLSQAAYTGGLSVQSISPYSHKTRVEFNRLCRGNPEYQQAGGWLKYQYAKNIKGHMRILRGITSTVGLQYDFLEQHARHDLSALPHFNKAMRMTENRGDIQRYFEALFESLQFTIRENMSEDMPDNGKTGIPATPEMDDIDMEYIHALSPFREPQIKGDPLLFIRHIGESYMVLCARFLGNAVANAGIVTNAPHLTRDQKNTSLCHIYSGLENAQYYLEEAEKCIRYFSAHHKKTPLFAGASDPYKPRALH